MPRGHGMLGEEILVDTGTNLFEALPGVRSASSIALLFYGLLQQPTMVRFMLCKRLCGLVLGGLLGLFLFTVCAIRSGH